MSLQRLVNMPMVCVRGRASERVIELDWSVGACESAILSGDCCAEATVRSEISGTDERSSRYIVFVFVVLGQRGAWWSVNGNDEAGAGLARDRRYTLLIGQFDAVQKAATS